MSTEPNGSVRSRSDHEGMSEPMTDLGGAAMTSPLPHVAPEALTLLALNAAAHRLFTLGAEDMSASEKSTALQSVGEEVERQAQLLIGAVRRLRGIPDGPGRVVPLPVPSATAPEPGPGPLNGDRARRTMRELETFTLSELTGALNCRENDARKYLHAALVAVPPVLKRDGKLGRTPVYTWCAPPPEVPKDPTSHPKGPNPEHMAGVGVDRRATGEPVRVAAMSRLTRQGRSTGGMAHIHRQRDLRYDRMQQAQAERAQAQAEKAKEQRSHSGGKKRRGK